MHDKRRTSAGHLKVEERGKGRVWIAKHNNTPDGKWTRVTLGLAHVRKTNRTTERGAPIWRAGDGPKPEGHLTPEDAREALDALLRTKLEQRATRRAGTFGEACDAYLKRAERDLEASTFRGYSGIVRTHLLPRIGERTALSSITTATVEKLCDDLLDAGKAPRTVRHAHVTLHGILARAVKAGVIETNPAERAEKVRVKASGDFNFLEPEQVEAIARCAGGQDGALIRFAAYSGLRMGELRALRWEDVDFAHALIRVRRNAPTSAPIGAEKAPKSGKVRTVPLTDAAAAAIDPLSRRELFTGPEDRVFPSVLGYAFADGPVRDAFYAAVGSAGLGRLREKDNPITFHDLRHVFGSLAVRVAEVPKVQAWMGHADIATTMIYVHTMPQHDDAARLSRAFAIESTAEAVTISA